MMNNLEFWELVKIIAVCAVFAGTMAYMALRAIQDYWLDDDEYVPDDDDFEEVIETAIVPILLLGEPFKDGDKVYDMHNGIVSTYCGTDEHGAVCCYYKSEFSVCIYHTDIGNLMKIAVR